MESVEELDKKIELMRFVIEFCDNCQSQGKPIDEKIIYVSREERSSMEKTLKDEFNKLNK